MPTIAPTPAAPTVLFVEDDNDVRFLLEMVATRSGLNSLSAPDGLQGLEVARSANPDLISVDIHMPGLGGIDLCRELRTFYDGPVIVVSAVAHDTAGEEALMAGADRLVSKPFQVSEFASILLTTLGLEDR